LVCNFRPFLFILCISFFCDRLIQIRTISCSVTNAACTVAVEYLNLGARFGFHATSTIKKLLLLKIFLGVLLIIFYITIFRTESVSIGICVLNPCPPQRRCLARLSNKLFSSCGSDAHLRPSLRLAGHNAATEIHRLLLVRSFYLEPSHCSCLPVAWITGESHISRQSNYWNWWLMTYMWGCGSGLHSKRIQHFSSIRIHKVIDSSGCNADPDSQQT
jgi:hypothetical protein